MALAPASAPPPGRLWYAVAVGVFLLGMAGMGVFLLSRLSGMDDGLVQLVVPGERAIPLEAGRYTIFHERQSVVDGRLYDSAGLGGLGVSVTGPDGRPVPVEAAAISGRYSFGSRVGFAAFEFEAAAPGSYTVAGGYAPGATGPQTVLAVGKNFLSSILTTVFGGLAFAFGGAIIAAVIGVRTLLKRRRAGLRF